MRRPSPSRATRWRVGGVEQPGIRHNGILTDRAAPDPCEDRPVVELRGATPADAHAIATVQVASWRVAYRGLMPDEVLAGLSVPDVERVWLGRLTTPKPRTRTVLAAAGATVFGFASTGPPLVPEDSSDPALGDLYAIYLHPDVWGRGLGTRLHAAALDGLRDCGFTRAGLWVLDGNERALRFYRREGWTDTGRTQVDRGPDDIELHERRLQRYLASPASGPPGQ
jgi:GNAT superfamily N-acetyltransferase